jgi:carboxylesterase
MMGGFPLGTLEASGRAPAVLALHGFGATTQEVSMIVDIARDLGLAALAPLLPGHGTSAYDLARTRFVHWRAAAERALWELVRDHAGAIVVGSSMGSLVALDLAADHSREVVGVGVLGCPIRLYWPYPSLALAAIERLGIPDFMMPKLAPDILDAEGRRTHVTYRDQPVYAGNDVRRAGRRVEARLGAIACPAFVAHGRRDRVCPVRNARVVYDRLRTPPPEKELLILKHSRHIITRDVEREALRARLSGFIARLAARWESGDANARSHAGGAVPVRCPLSL